uniref:non-specific serine/threonine protein kinase n=1 Tax=Pyramimonas obovata TaxID=1411642 RepID=A0A7S0N0H1_9CHLO|mmetsp:Transcript_15317/g.33052  ORF Transcript_15317/g.33052 Transcript_15317/m.33052 type:complete len:1008 (+) Transcript_15317:471-3494(+)
MERSLLARLLKLLLLLKLYTAANVTESNAKCTDMLPGVNGTTVAVSDERQLAAALLDPAVACVLITTEVFRFTPEFWAPEGEFFRSKPCVRYTWPFCDDQYISREVVVAPSGPHKWTHMVFPRSGLYFTVFQFAGPGLLYLVNIVTYGTFYFDDLIDPSRVQYMMELGTSSASNTLDLSDLFDMDRRHTFGGNNDFVNGRAMMGCGESHLVAVPIMSSTMFPNSTLSPTGQIMVEEPHATVTNIVDPRLIASSGGRLPQELVPLEVASTTFRMQNVSVGCCEALPDSDAGSLFSRLCAELLEDRSSAASVSEYVLEEVDGNVLTTTTYRGFNEELSQPAAQSACEKRHGGTLASFDFSARALEVVRQVLSKGELRNHLFFRKSLWLGSTVAPSSEAVPTFSDAFFWDGQTRWGGRGDCLLLSAHSLQVQPGNCSLAHSFICMWTAHSDLPVDSPSSPSPFNSTAREGGGSALLPVHQTIALIVAGGLGLCVLLLLAVWHRRSFRASSCLRRNHRETLPGTEDPSAKQSGEHLMERATRAPDIEVIPSVLGLQTNPAPDPGVCIPVDLSKLHQRCLERPVTAAGEPNSGDRSSQGLDTSTAPAEDGQVDLCSVDDYVHHLWSTWKTRTLSLSDPWFFSLQSRREQENHLNERSSTDEAMVSSTGQGADCIGKPLAINSGNPKALLEAFRDRCYEAFPGYTVLHPVGNGSHALCLLVRQNQTGLHFVAKIPFEAHVIDTLQEAYFLTALNCPNIVRVHDILVIQDQLIVLMDYSNLGSVKAALALPQVSRERVRFATHMLYQVSLALSHLHANMIAHRDIKPENIVLNSDGIFKLIDFGVSRILVGTSTTFAGTPLFMAPEVLQGEPYTRESDVWSLAAAVCAVVRADGGDPATRAKVYPTDLPTLQRTLREMRTTVPQLLTSECGDAALCETVNAMLADQQVRLTAAEICNLPWLKDKCTEDHAAFVVMVAAAQPEASGGSSEKYRSTEVGRAEQQRRGEDAAAAGFV